MRLIRDPNNTLTFIVRKGVNLSKENHPIENKHKEELKPGRFLHLLEHVASESCHGDGDGDEGDGTARLRREHEERRGSWSRTGRWALKSVENVSCGVCWLMDWLRPSIYEGKVLSVFFFFYNLNV